MHPLEGLVVVAVPGDGAMASHARGGDVGGHHGCTVVPDTRGAVRAGVPVGAADVTAKVRAMERRRDEGVAAASGRGPTLSEWLEHWLTTIAAAPRATADAGELRVRRPQAPDPRHRAAPPRPAAAGAPRPALHRPARRRLLPRLRAPAPPHPVPGPHGRRPARPRPAQRRRPRRPARPAAERPRHRPRPRRGPRRPGSRRSRPQLRPLDRRPRPRPAPVRGPRAAVEGHRPAQQHPHGPAQHPPRPRAGA